MLTIYAADYDLINNGRKTNHRPQQFLYFLPLPQGQGSLRPTFGPVRTGLALAWASAAAAASLTTSLALPAHGGTAAKRARVLVQGLLRDVLQKIFKRHHARRAAENVVADFRFHVDHQFVKNLERLGLVFQQRIALAVRAQADAVAQAVHLVKMLLPQFVNRAQNREALDLLQRVGILKTDFDVVSLADAVGNEMCRRRIALRSIRHTTNRPPAFPCRIRRP